MDDATRKSGVLEIWSDDLCGHGRAINMILSIVQDLQKRMIDMAKWFDDLVVEIRANADVEASAIAAINELIQRLIDAPTSQEVMVIVEEIKARKAEVLAAIAAVPPAV